MLNRYSPKQTYKPKTRLLQSDTFKFYMYVMPWLIGAALFTFVPMISSLLSAFTNSTVFSDGSFIGLGNFLEMFTQDQLFRKSLINTLIFAFVSVPLGIILALMLALLLSEQIRGASLFRSIFFLPTILSVLQLHYFGHSCTTQIME